MDRRSQGESSREDHAFYHAFLADKTRDNWQKYHDARRNAKKDLAAAKAARYDELYKKLNTHEGERDISRLMKSRHRQTEDIKKLFGVNDENVQLINDRKKAVKRWQDYFEKISTEEFPYPLPLFTVQWNRSQPTKLPKR